MWNWLERRLEALLGEGWLCLGLEGRSGAAWEARAPH